MMEPDPIELAARALRDRDRSSQEIDDRLARAGIDAAARADALETLSRIGYVDDARTSAARAAELAARTYGDAYIRFDLERRGIAADVIEAALTALEPEAKRARAAADTRGATSKTAAFLARRGFGEESLESVVAGRADVS